jgi:hypothetical protein
MCVEILIQKNRLKIYFNIQIFINPWKNCIYGSRDDNFEENTVYCVVLKVIGCIG